jgi:galactonate dehydratase
MRALLPFNVRFMEEPAMTYDVRSYRDLQQMNLIPVAGGESFCSPEEFEPFFEAGAFGVVQPDAAVTGGPASCREVCRRALELEVPVSMHAWSAGVGLAQNLHASWSIDGVMVMEWPLTFHPLATSPIEGMGSFVDGYMLPGTKPGLGLNLNDEWLAQFAYQPGSERDY